MAKGKGDPVESIRKEKILTKIGGKLDMLKICGKLDMLKICGKLDMLQATFWLFLCEIRGCRS